jgi:hypothetical protein
MPLLQPPAPDLRSTDLSYTHAYNSIVSRVHRSTGSGSGGVVILVGVDVVGPILKTTRNLSLISRMVCLRPEYWFRCSGKMTFLTAWCLLEDTLSSKLGETKPCSLKKCVITIDHHTELIIATYVDFALVGLSPASVDLLHPSAKLSPSHH